MLEIDTATACFSAGGSYTPFGPFMRFSGDGDTAGRGHTVLNLWLKSVFNDEFAVVVYACRGFRQFKKLQAGAETQQ